MATITNSLCTNGIEVDIQSSGGALKIGTAASATVITIGNTTVDSGVILTTGSAGTTFSGFAEGALITSSAGKVSTITGTAGYVLTANSAGTAPSFQPAAGGGGGITWNNTTGSTQAMAVNNGYVSNDGSTLVTFTLPSTASVSQIVAVQGSGTGKYTIAQNSGQRIHFNGAQTTTGTGGTVSSTSTYDVIYLMCTTANTTWAVNSSVGNFSIV